MIDRSMSDVDALLFHYARARAEQLQYAPALLKDDLRYASYQLPHLQDEISKRLGQIELAVPGQKISTRLLYETLPSAKATEVDVIIITIKRVEFDATLLAFGIDPTSPRQTVVAGADVHETVLRRPGEGGQVLRVIITMGCGARKGAAVNSEGGRAG